MRFSLYMRAAVASRRMENANSAPMMDTKASTSSTAISAKPRSFVIAAARSGATP